MTSLRPILAFAAAAALAALFSGCSVAVVDKSPDSGSAAGGTQSPPTDGGAPPIASDPITAPAGVALDRETVISAATTVRRCDDELTIIDDALTARIDGSCDRIILNSTASTIVTDDVGYLEVIGDGNVVFAGDVTKLLVNGEGNVVHWSGQTPAVTDVGTSNVLTAE